MDRRKLITSKNYILTRIQVRLFNLVKDYLDSPGKSQSELAKKLGCTRGYISQVLKGNYDHRLSKFIELSRAIGKVPVVNFMDETEYIAKELTTDYLKLKPIHPYKMNLVKMKAIEKDHEDDRHDEPLKNVIHLPYS